MIIPDHTDTLAGLKLDSALRVLTLATVLFGSFTRTSVEDKLAVPVSCLARGVKRIFSIAAAVHFSVLIAHGLLASILASRSILHRLAGYRYVSSEDSVRMRTGREDCLVVMKP